MNLTERKTVELTGEIVEAVWENGHLNSLRIKIWIAPEHRHVALSIDYKDLDNKLDILLAELTRVRNKNNELSNKIN